MNRETIQNALCLFQNDWALVTAGTEASFNSMTVSWGGLGTLWRKPVVTVYIRPNRYTHGFLESNEYFTVGFYSEEYKKALGIMGSKSGRDCDKVALSGLTPVALKQGVTYREAGLTLLCRKVYRQVMDKDAIPGDILDNCFKDDPSVHTLFIGEVVDVL